MNKPKIHPVAEFFPMMTEEELDELAADIKANGLLNPIVRDNDGTLIDGRNRFEACKRAGVLPTFETLNGIDPIAYILAQNDKRRHMTKGQRAMVAAKVRVFNTQSFSKLSETTKVSREYIAHASIVLQYRPELAEEVMNGKPLNEAYAEALQEKERKESDEFKRNRLRREAADLADQVNEETLTLSEAMAALQAREYEEQQRQESLKQQRQLSTRFLCETISSFDPYTQSVEEKADRFLDLFESKFSTEEITPERLSNCADVLKTLAKKWKTKNG